MAPVQGRHRAQGTHRQERPQHWRQKHKLHSVLTSSHTSLWRFLSLSQLIRSTNSYFRFERR